MSKPNLKKLTRNLLVLGSAVAATLGMFLMMLILSGYFQRKVPTASPPALSHSETPASTAVVAAIQIPRSETAVGTIRSANEVAVASKLLAQVLEVRVKAGQAVKKGEVLVRLDEADLVARLRQAESAHQSALAMAEQTNADLARAVKLIEKQAITQAEYDQTLSADRSAKAEVQRTAQAIEETKVQLEYATIRAPFNGVVIDKRIEAGDTATPGRVLVEIYEPGRMQLVAIVRESLAAKLKVGDMLSVDLESLGYQCFAAISEIVPQAEAASRSFTIKVTGPCPEGIYSGMFGRLTIPLDQEQVTLVPDAAIKRVGQLTLVEVVTNERIQRRSIQVGRKLEGGFEVLSGLQPGEVVVTDSTGNKS